MFWFGFVAGGFIWSCAVLFTLGLCVAVRRRDEQIRAVEDREAREHNEAVMLVLEDLEKLDTTSIASRIC